MVRFPATCIAGMRRENATVNQGPAGRHVLIVAPSGRALACAARRAGSDPARRRHVRRRRRPGAMACRVIPGGLTSRFEIETLIPLLEDLEDECGEAALGVVYGGGFEDRPRASCGPWPGAGRCSAPPPNVVERVKDPVRLAAALAVARRSPSGNPPVASAISVGLAGQAPGRRRWRPCAGRGQRRDCPKGGVYYQRRVEGRPVSALFVAAPGKGCVTLGFSDQWTAPCVAHPYRYGGAVRPAAVDRRDDGGNGGGDRQDGARIWPRGPGQRRFHRERRARGASLRSIPVPARRWTSSIATKRRCWRCI